MRRIVDTLCAALIALMAHAIFAESVTTEVTVAAIDSKGGSVTFTDESGDSLKLDIGKKTTLTIGDKPMTLQQMTPGVKGTLTYEDSLETVISFEVVDPASQGTDLDGISLFNGNDFDGLTFVPNPKAKPDEFTLSDCWGIDAEEGILFANGKGNTWLQTDDQYDNFVLTFEWRLTEGKPKTGNGSGVVVRSNGLHSVQLDPRGVEIDLSETGTGSFLLYGSPLKNANGKAAGENTQRLDAIKKPQLKPAGVWNRTEIRCDGDKITVNVNGRKVNEGTGARTKKGAICLRSQSSGVEFRNTILRPLPSK